MPGLGSVRILITIYGISLNEQLVMGSVIGNEIASCLAMTDRQVCFIMKDGNDGRLASHLRLRHCEERSNLIH